MFTTIVRVLLVAFSLFLIYMGYSVIRDSWHVYHDSINSARGNAEGTVCTSCIYTGYLEALVYFIFAALTGLFVIFLPKPETVSRIIHNSINGFKAFFTRYPELVIFVTITLIAFISFHAVKANHTGASKKIENHFRDSDLVLSKKIMESKRLDSINLCSNLKQYYVYIDKIKQAKLELSKKFEGFITICYTIGIFFVAMTGIIGFIITKKGWDSSSRIRKALFLSFAFYAIIFPGFPRIFNQAESFKTHFEDYSVLTQSQLYIFSRLGPYIDKKDNKLNKEDSNKLFNAMDTVGTILLNHTKIEINIDAKQLEGIRTFEMNAK